MNEDLKQIGQRLKGLRDVLDIDAQEIADLLGISLEEYEKMEGGESELSVEQFCGFLNVSATYFSMLFKKETPAFLSSTK